MLKKKGKRKSKKTTTTTRGGVKVINNIHVNSKSGTRSKRQQRGGVGGSVAPSGASTISHVPLVMNVPAPDSTQRETQYLHAIKNVQDDILRLNQAAGILALQQQPPAPDPADTLRFQEPPSTANHDEDVKAEAKRTHSTPRGRETTPRPTSLPPPSQPRSAQGVGLKGSHLSGQSTLDVPTAEHPPMTKAGGQPPKSPAKKGRPPSAQKQAKKAAEEVEAGKQRTMEEFKK